MELLLVIVLGVPLGRFVPGRTLAWAILAVAFLIVLPIQTISVRHEGNLDAQYWPVQALIATLGAGLVFLGARWRAKHAAHLRPPERPDRAPLSGGLS